MGGKSVNLGTSLVLQRQRLHAPYAGGPRLIPGQGTRSHNATIRRATMKIEDSWVPPLKPLHSQINNKLISKKEKA